MCSCFHDVAAHEVAQMNARIRRAVDGLTWARNLEAVIEMCILGLAVMIEIFSLVND